MNDIKKLGLGRHDSYKNCREIKDFLQGLVDEEMIKAYSIEIDKQITEEDNEKEKVIRVVKGISLSPINYIIDESLCFFQDASNQLLYTAGFDFHSSEDCKRWTFNLTRLVKDVNLEDLNKGKTLHIKDIPYNMITGKLEYSLSEFSEPSHGRSTFLKIDRAGERDNLFSGLENFLSE